LQVLPDPTLIATYGVKSVVKVIVAIKRSQALSPKDFHEQWQTQHARLVKACPASKRYLRKYVQCHTIDEEYLRGEPAFDGTAELWFDTIEDKEKFFSDPDYLSEVKPDEPRISDMSRTLFFLTQETFVI
jgi:uncharacterized protein (TIGR02118 family)